jgi:hypothetical protein
LVKFVLREIDAAGILAQPLDQVGTGDANARHGGGRVAVRDRVTGKRANWRHAASDRPTADATSGKLNPNTSRSTKTARSSGLSRSSSNRAAIDNESANSADRAGSS